MEYILLVVDMGTRWIWPVSYLIRLKSSRYLDCLQEFMDPGEFLAWVTTNMVRKKGRGVSPVVLNLSAVCIASLADARNRQNGIRDVDDTEYEPIQLRKLRAACDKKYVVFTDRIHGFGDNSVGHPCAVCNEGPAVIDADGKKWSPCRS